MTDLTSMRHGVLTIRMLLDTVETGMTQSQQKDLRVMNQATASLTASKELRQGGRTYQSLKGSEAEISGGEAFTRELRKNIAKAALEKESADLAPVKKKVKAEQQPAE